MKQEIYTAANKIWQQFTKDAKDIGDAIPFKVDTQLLNHFHVGEYYYYIFNVKNAQFELMSQEIAAVLGYEPESVDVPFFLGCIHPEDRAYFLNFENKVAEFFSSLKENQILNYKVSYDYRILKKDGNYIRILQQVFTIQADGKNVIKTFGVHTNISHLKPTGAPTLSFIGMKGEPSHINVDARNIFASSTIILTRREREVLELLIEGKSSEQISQTLFISKLTVDTHRKNLLRKTECLNTAALTSMAVQKGWV